LGVSAKQGCGRISQRPNKRKLTHLLVKRAKPRARPYMVWDTQQRGLALRVEPSGYKAFKVVYRHHNRPRWYHLGAADAIGLAEARKLAQAIMYKVAQGQDPQAERKAARGTGTFAEIAERYVEEYAKRRNKSWPQAAALVRKHLIPIWSKLATKDIARSDVRAMMGRIKAPVAANQTLAAASAVFSWAVKQEIIAINPCSGVERNETKSRERVLAEAELPLFWQAFDELDLMRGAALKVLLLTGQRPGEVAHMRWEYVRDGWWTMPGAPAPPVGWPGTKNGQTHRVWLPQAVQGIITELSVENSGYVFSNDGRHPIKRLSQAMQSICKQLGVERATPHDLRRTHGSTITALGFGRDAMNRVQNHREGGIASVYDRHGYAEETKRVMEAVAAKIMSLVEGRSADDGNIKW
jgi:integrase